MAEYDPAHQGASWNENGGYEVTVGNTQENNPQHSTDQDQAEYSVDSAHHDPGDVPSPGGATDDVGDYDPESVTAEPAPAAAPQVSASPSASTAPPQRAAKQKPRTAGGFLVGDSDSEDDNEAPVPASSGHVPDAASQSSVPHASLQQHPIAAKQATAASSTADPAPQVNAPPTNQQENGNTSATISAAAGPATVDKIAQLEERVRDDPRGAMDAWLSLIAEYRSKNDIEKSRLIYDRFLAVVPQAVSRCAQY